MALTAQITQALLGGVANTYLFAGWSYVRLHGYDSTLDGSAHRIVDYEWDDGEGHIQDGPTATFDYASAGPKTVTLKVTDEVGAQSTATLDLTFTTWTGTTIYVATAGNDSTGDGSISLPYKTADKAFTVAAGITALGAPPKVVFNDGDVLTSGAANAFPAPCLIDNYGTGTKAKIRIATDQNLYAQRGTAWHNAWGYAVNIRNVDFDWAIVSGHNSNKVGVTSPGSSITNAVVTGGLVEGSQGSSDPISLTWDNVEVTGKDASSGGGGFGISNSGGVGAGLVTFLGMRDCFAHGNSPGIATNVYLHGTIVEVRGCVFDGESNGVQSAFFSSGMRRYSIIDCEARNAHEGFGVGSNGSGDGSAEAQDCWIDRVRVTNCTVDGINLQYTNRAIIKNYLIDSCAVGILLNHTNGVAGERTQNVEVLNGVIYACGNQGIFTDGVRAIMIRNNIIVRTSDVDASDKKFIQLGFIGGTGSTDDYLYVTCDYNLYYRSGESSGTSNTFMENNANKTFTQWQTDGFDAHGSFGLDPLLTNPAAHDFTLQAGSPAIDHGTPEPIVYRDFTDTIRGTIDSAIDVGAYEWGTVGQTISPTSILRATIDV